MPVIVTESVSQISQLNSSLPLQGECVTFTGRLASMNHRDAAALVETYGGRAVSSMSKSVTMVIIGEEGWPLEEDGQPSQKMLAATAQITDGADLRLVAESDWLHLIGLNERRDEIKRSYTPAMLSRLLDLPVGMIRRWSRIGLIRPVRRVCRLPYFDFREVSNAQRLASLLQDGIKAEVLEESLGQLSLALTGTDRSLAQLNLLIQDKKVVLRDTHGVLNPRTGQRLLDFEETAALTVVADDCAVDDCAADGHAAGDRDQAQTEIHTADVRPAAFPAEDSVDARHSLQLSVATEQTPSENRESDSAEQPVSLSFEAAVIRRDERSMNDFSAGEWFHEGCWLAEESEFDSAINAFRNCLSRLSLDQMNSPLGAVTGAPGSMTSDPADLELFPDPADVHFHLADALYRAGAIGGAIERYHCAIEFAPDFIEAWTQLGCLLAETQAPGRAEEAFQTAISIHPSNPDALLHYAQLLDEMARTEEAAGVWEKYLRYDSRGPWADHARKRLGIAEVT
ncbi:MAG: tetratricopeptide repeat protein [Fuerstiella sp.]